MKCSLKDYSFGIYAGVYICNNCGRAWHCGQYGENKERIKCPECGRNVYEGPNDN